MLSGTIIFVNGDSGIAADMESAMTELNPTLQITEASTGRETLELQAATRAEAVVMDAEIPDMESAQLLRALKRDIVNPYVMVCMTEWNMQRNRMMLKLGAGECIYAPLNAAEQCRRLIGTLNRRAVRQKDGCFAEAALQRMFTDCGMPGNLKGYAYLKRAMRLIDAGDASTDRMRQLYERVAEDYGCSVSNVERNIRYAIALCWERRGENTDSRPTNSGFIVRLMEESGLGKSTLIQPRVSVFAAGRRVFR